MAIATEWSNTLV